MHAKFGVACCFYLFLLVTGPRCQKYVQTSVPKISGCAVNFGVVCSFYLFLLVTWPSVNFVQFVVFTCSYLLFQQHLRMCVENLVQFVLVLICYWPIFYDVKAKCGVVCSFYLILFVLACYLANHTCLLAKYFITCKPKQEQLVVSTCL